VERAATAGEAIGPYGKVYASPADLVAEARPRWPPRAGSGMVVAARQLVSLRGPDMRVAGMVLIVLGAALAIGLAAVESAQKWSSAPVNVIKLVGWAMLIAGVFMVFSKKKS
jgi:hypothetical protein